MAGAGTSAKPGVCVETPTSRLRLGVGRYDITPPVGIYHRFWGAALHDQAAGVHRPLTATVAIFAPAEGAAAESQVLVALDHCLLRPVEMDEALAKVAELTGVPSEHWLFAFSHTHSGAHLNRDRKNLPGGEHIGPYLDQLPHQIAAAYRQALATLQPAVVTYGQGVCPMGRHRDFWDEVSQQWICGLNPGGVIDDSVVVGRATAADGRLLATFVNYGCHPTTLAWENDQISPDYIGAMRETVERATGAPCLFLLSPCGDVGPGHGFVGDVRVPDQNGRQLGYAALSVHEGLPPAGHDYHYVGPVISGATLGRWEYRPHDSARQRAAGVFRARNIDVPAAYLDDMPTLAEAERQLGELVAQEKVALASGNETAARDARALAERKRRELDRIRPLPAGDRYPIALKAWQFGDAFWLAVEGEPYNWLQARLRERFRGRPVLFTTIANGARNCYMPTREAYGRKLYQVDIALLAPGCLEACEEALGRQIDEWLAEG